MIEKVGTWALCLHRNNEVLILIFTHQVGILPPGNIGLIPFAYQIYASPDKKIGGLAKGFKRTFSAKALIKFVGVW
jgi:hypothetical protein